MEPEEIRDYYLQEEVRQRMMEIAKYREIVPTYPESYGSRPDALNFPGDFAEMVEQGAVSFHGSVEIWRNPLLIDTVSNLNNLRTAWDLVIDIDCDQSFEVAKTTALTLINFLKDYGLDPDVKFSGNRGFHLGLHRSCFPHKIQGKDMAQWYPQLPQAMVDFLRESCQQSIAEQTELDDPYQVVEIESDWGQRHLFRLPYSLHQKTWLTSFPLAQKEVSDFSKEQAAPDSVDFSQIFLDGDKDYGDATNLVVQALDWKSKQRAKETRSKHKRKKGDYNIPKHAIPPENFPPCIQLIREGLQDGRKRSLFILLNFLQKCGYGWQQIEDMIWDWNQENKEELPPSYVQSQLNWHQSQEESVAPPNCDSKSYYIDIGICQPDSLCKKIRNPLAYAFKKHFSGKKSGKGKSKGQNKEEDEETFECPYCGKEYKSEKWFKKALLLKPEHREAYTNLLNLYTETAREEDALETYQKYLDLYPDDSHVRKPYINLLVKHEKFSQVIEQIMKFMPYSKGDAQVKRLLALSLRRTRQYSQAAVLYKDLLVQDAENVEFIKG